MKSQMFTDGFEMVRDAKVKVSQSTTPKSMKQVAVIEIGKNQHTFSPDSRVSRALAASSPADIEKRMNGGDFFFHRGQLVNFQYGDRKGFVHSNESIQALIDHVGFTDSNINRVQRTRLTSSHVRLQRVHSDVEIEIPAYQDGGQLSSQLSFAWDPFQQCVTTAFELVRLICTNGMTGLSSFLSNRIPLVNEWQEHLAIANKQIQNTVTSMIVRRMEEMTAHRATVRDCQRIAEICRDRLDLAENHADDKARTILMNNAYIVDPHFHLKDHYSATALSDRRMTDQLQSHLNLFTVWNMLTEIATHTHSESNFGVHKHANEIVFDRTGGSVATTQPGAVKLSPVFSNAEAALVGDQL